VLNRAFANDPISIAVLLTNAESFGGGAIKPPAPMCEVNFQCSRICPGGIIGRLNYVNCEIANASAVSSCRAGLPFARSYNCDLQFPAFGILIPGLYPGLSIIFPGGSIDVLVQGDGRIDFRVHFDGPSIGPINLDFDTEGSYQPSNGDVRIEGSGGIDISLPSSNSPVLDTLKQAGFEPGIQLHFDPAQATSGYQFEPSIADFHGAIVG
jgi:hypothetical protein